MPSAPLIVELPTGSYERLAVSSLANLSLARADFHQSIQTQPPSKGSAGSEPRVQLFVAFCKVSFTNGSYPCTFIQFNTLVPKLKKN